MKQNDPSVNTAEFSALVQRHAKLLEGAQQLGIDLVDAF
jgi:hypothetical protein